MQFIIEDINLSSNDQFIETIFRLGWGASFELTRELWCCFVSSLWCKLGFKFNHSIQKSALRCCHVNACIFLFPILHGEPLGNGRGRNIPLLTGTGNVMTIVKSKITMA